MRHNIYIYIYIKDTKYKHWKIIKVLVSVDFHFIIHIFHNQARTHYLQNHSKKKKNGNKLKIPMLYILHTKNSKIFTNNLMILLTLI